MPMNLTETQLRSLIVELPIVVQKYLYGNLNATKRALDFANKKLPDGQKKKVCVTAGKQS